MELYGVTLTSSKRRIWPTTWPKRSPRPGGPAIAQRIHPVARDPQAQVSLRWRKRTMMKPDFVFVKNNYPRKGAMPTAALYASIGWSDVLDKPAFTDTCATRVSIALIRSGVTIPGARMPINAGPLKGKRIEPGREG
jgi:hypothetical protein